MDEEDEVICAICGSGFPREEMVEDESEGLVCKNCYDQKDKCEGGYIYPERHSMDGL